MEELKVDTDGLRVDKVCKNRAETFMCLEMVQRLLA